MHFAGGLNTVPGSAAVSPPVLRREVAFQAAQWFVRLHSGEATAADQQNCAAWRAESEEHERAWQRAVQVSQCAASVPAALAGPVLGRVHRGSNRRDAAGALMALMVAAPTAWLAWRGLPWEQWSASHATATGEQKAWTLADGSRIVLDTASAVDVRFDRDQRTIDLWAGAVWVETSPDPQPQARPFVVRTVHGSVRAIGTRFTVHKQAQSSQAAVLQGMVEITAKQGLGRQLLHAGQQAAFDAQTIGAIESTGPGAGHWARGLLVVQDMRLDAFVAELARYRHGLLRCDPVVASLRLTGAFQLADTDAVLQNLAHLLPLKLSWRSRYWVTLSAASP